MKKGLSVLLIAAALFGFYGGAVSINDVLACKDYWEKEGEKSTADMNKLEDGLNQLKDNEQAYLDGLETLAEGEKTLADGEAQYAQGLEDYEAAPGKLAAAREAISEGEGQLSDLKDLINGIQQVLDNYPTFRNGYKQLKEGRDNSLANPTDTSALEGVIGAYISMPEAQATYAKLTEAGQKLATQQKGSYTNEQYDGFKDYLVATAAALEAGKTMLDAIKTDLNGNATDFNTVLSEYMTGVGIYKQTGDTAALMAAIGKAKDLPSTNESDFNEVEKAINNLILDPTTKAYATGAFNNAKNGLGNGPTEMTEDGLTAYGELIGTIPALVSKIGSGIDDLKSGMIQENLNNANLWIGGYNQLQEKRVAKDGLPKLVSGISQIVGGVYGSGNKELISGMNKAANAFGFNAHSLTPTATSMLTKDLNSKSWMENFYNDGNKVEKAFKSVLPKLKKKYSAGNKTLKAGKAQYAQGLADYAAAPGKLADAEKQLADGRQQLADGKKKLAEYEDGEQQVRDGLATLMGTEADLDLESILDRRNGDDNFDDPNGHLQLDEGLDAVKTGREYQADDGVLITKEITARAIGTVGCLAAAALAILAGVLSLLKKYKAAAVSGILTAIAGAVGIAQGMSAGEYFSSIAGSTVGNTPFIAAGVLAAVAAVFAIVNFTAKKEEA